jgi:hypothetical protein
MNELVNVNEATNGAQAVIDTSMPYSVRITLEGAADFLFHRWNPDAVDAKAGAAKGSKAKKTDDIESYTYRDEKGVLCIPGEYLRMAIIAAAKFRQDPRSPRKSAMDLYKAAIVPLTILAPLGVKKWDYEDRRRVVIQRSGVNRVRPAMRAGWKAEFELLVNLPEYVRPGDLHDVVGMAGRLVGLGDFRPTYGRFRVTKFEVVNH